MSTFQNKPASNKETCQRSRTHKQHGTEKKNTGEYKSFSPSPKDYHKSHINWDLFFITLTFGNFVFETADSIFLDSVKY